MNWKVADAKQKLSEVIRAAEEEPQWLYNRDRLVGAVVEPSTLREFLTWRERSRRPTLGEAFSELRKLCSEERYTFELPSRNDRPNPFADDDLSV
jgi:CHAD domain-containing protein